jgi:bifunctional UDP-N-acetylglucosamine pyrophosphorylase/glucosamine-1-phosphate N-acetyltransferase
VEVVAIVLAAGRGTRMRSERPKVLHELHGRALVRWVVRAAVDAGAGRLVVVVAPDGDEVRAAVRAEVGAAAEFAVQAEARGTGHAVVQALSRLERSEPRALILSGDVPLLRPDTLRRLVAAHASSTAGLSLLTFRPADPAGYGRVVRDADGAVRAVREHRDASDVEREIDECNAGVYCVDVEQLRRELPHLRDDNAKGELYLTDLVELLAVHGHVGTVGVDPAEVAGVNTPEQLKELEKRASDPARP